MSSLYYTKNVLSLKHQPGDLHFLGHNTAVRTGTWGAKVRVTDGHTHIKTSTHHNTLSFLNMTCMACWNEWKLLKEIYLGVQAVKLLLMDTKLHTHMQLNVLYNFATGTTHVRHIVCLPF